MENQNELLKQFEQLRKVVSLNILLQKPVLNFQETCQYLDISSSHLYKLTSKRAIPHFCPNGKKLYFKRDELDVWLLRNKQLSLDEIEEHTDAFLSRKRGRR